MVEETVETGVIELISILLYFSKIRSIFWWRKWEDWAECIQSNKE